MLGVSIGRVSLIVFSMATVFSIGLTSPIAHAIFLTPVEIIDNSGDGGNILDTSHGVATDSSGNVFVTGSNSDNAFKITKDVVVGGINISIDTSALLLAGVQSISMWMIPVVIAGAGIGVFVIKRRN